MRRALPLVVSLVAVSALAHCEDRDANGALCSEVPLDGPEVTVQRLQEAAPESTGGALADGRYVLTAAREYGVPASLLAESAGVTQATVEITGNTFSTVGRAPGSGMRRFRGPYSIEGATLHLRPDCPVAAMGEATFSVTGDGFTLCAAENGRIRCADYTRR